MKKGSTTITIIRDLITKHKKQQQTHEERQEEIEKIWGECGRTPAEWRAEVRRAKRQSPEPIRREDNNASNTIHDDGYADGGEPYTDEEVALINAENAEASEKAAGEDIRAYYYHGTSRWHWDGRKWIKDY